MYNVNCGTGWTRIIVGWDPSSVDLIVLNQYPQVVHCFVKPLHGQRPFYLSILYGNTHYIPRRFLWDNLKSHNCVVKDNPWALMGDFNAILDPSESTSSSKLNAGIIEFRECVEEIDMQDLSMMGLFYIWNQKPSDTGGILKKLDRVMGNDNFISNFPTASARFLPYLVSDHSPSVLLIPELKKVKPKPFRFSNFLATK